MIVIFIPVIAFGARLHPEQWYQEIDCSKRAGISEVVLFDQTRCDCITETNAIEYDFGNHWYRAIGQALHYALMTKKRAGIGLIIESDKDLKYWHRLNSVIRHFDLPIDTWQIKKE